MRGWVLAGGASTRFGSDKASFLVDGVPLAVRTARVLEAGGCGPVTVIGRHRRALVGVEQEIEPEGPRHPLWGVAEALRHGDAFVAPCDLPDLTPAIVAALRNARARAADQPLLGVFPAALRPRCLALARAGSPVRALADDPSGAAILDVGPLINLNRPARGAGGP
jgi:molybdopterin-guanine dinucleotide biosynthesis protein A